MRAAKGCPDDRDAGGFVALGAVEQFEPAVDGVSCVLRFDRFDISGVDEASAPSASRAQTGEGSESIRPRSEAMSRLHILMAGH